MIPKFKVWDKKNKKMLYQKDLEITFSDYGIYVHNEETYRVSDQHIHDFELLQSTGLRDKNGTEIYEGDIIDKGYHNISVFDRIGFVEHSDGYDSDGWTHGKWLGWITNNGDSLLDVHEACTVLGNKFEHSHLLEED